MEPLREKELLEVGFEALMDSNANYLDSDIAIFEELDVLPKINSVRLQFNAFCSCTQGQMDLSVNGVSYSIKKGETFICPSGLIITQLMISPDFKFKLLVLTDRVIQSLLSTNVNIWNKAVYVRKEHVARPVGDKQKNMGEHFLAIIRSLMEEKENPFREEMMRSILNIVLLSFCAHQNDKEEKSVAQPYDAYSQRRQQFARFMDLLKNEKVKYRPVYDYAAKLCITSKYLTNLCKEITGHSAAQFIQAAVAEEIDHYLRNTTLSVKEISVRMGFSSAPFFGKYVKGHFGISPNEYRKRLYAEKNRIFQ